MLGRTDDMMIIRGVNVFPSAVEQIIREFPEVEEYRLIADREGAMDALTIEIEDRLSDPRRVAHASASAAGTPGRGPSGSARFTAAI